MTAVAYVAAGWLTVAALIAVGLCRAVRIADRRDGDWWAAP